MNDAAQQRDALVNRLFEATLGTWDLLTWATGSASTQHSLAAR